MKDNKRRKDKKIWNFSTKILKDSIEEDVKVTHKITLFFIFWWRKQSIYFLMKGAGKGLIGALR